ncbi:hypothetical protein CC2G_011255 [Coprinopsis cinerea AmutBmut pab1-1]|nr:hypothetical protein CC2G_011255 [Coprinopsis cinerea AmutBmut pab1-1]
MISTSKHLFVLLPLFLVSHLSLVLGFPAYASLGGLTERQVEEYTSKLPIVFPPPPPEPIKDPWLKLVNDRAHPWRPLRRGDVRGPCPGLNTLASHGYLPRDGVATPAQIITAVQEGFNMEYGIATFVTYAAHLVDGNPLTNLISIGGKTRKTGPDPPPPAIVGGLNTHAVFEGDASMTRGDFHLGDNFNFNQTLWEQFKDYSNRYGGGRYNLTAAAELRWARIQQSMATNGQFDFTSPRYFTAYAESVFPINFFTDGRLFTSNTTAPGPDMDSALSFFRDHRYPKDFHRAPVPSGARGLDVVAAAYPIQPGYNADGKVNNYVLDPTSGISQSSVCCTRTLC